MPVFITSLLRHLLTAGGAYLINKGYTDAAGADAIIGGVMAVAGLGWSFYNAKTKA